MVLAKRSNNGNTLVVALAPAVAHHPFVNFCRVSKASMPLWTWFLDNPRQRKSEEIQFNV
jgi:hypothetical protein